MKDESFYESEDFIRAMEDEEAYNNMLGEAMEADRLRAEAMLDAAKDMPDCTGTDAEPCGKCMACLMAEVEAELGRVG